MQTALKKFETDSFRVDPIGFDANGSSYWYFFGTRLYREDLVTPINKKKNSKENGVAKKKQRTSTVAESVWQVICFTEEDWQNLTKKFSRAKNAQERELYQLLFENFLPKIPGLFRDKERERLRK